MYANGTTGDAPVELLLVEDQAVLALNQSRLLERSGYRVRTVFSGEEALEAIEAGESPQLVLMDIDLGPGIDGAEAAEKILARHDAPVIFLTSHRQKEVVDRVKGINGYGYVMKEAGEYVLLEAVRTALELHSAYREVSIAENRLRHLLTDFDGTAVQGYTQDGTVFFWNRASERLYGWSEREALGKKLWDLIIPDSMRSEVIAAVGEMVGTGTPLTAGELILHNRRGEPVEVYSSHSVYLPDNRELELFCIEIDISERNRMREKLKLINEVFSGLGTDPDENIHAITAATASILESPCSLYNKLDNRGESLVTWSGTGLPEGFRHEDLPDGHICYEATMRSEGRPVVLPELKDTVYAATDSNVRRFGLRSYLGYPVAINEEPIGALCIVDTRPRGFGDTELHVISTLAKGIELEERRRRANAEVRRLLEEKELLLRESHHRMKNDLSILRSLLSVQADAAADPGLSAGLEEAASRLAVMSRVYQRLSGSDQFRTIGLKPLLSEIVEDLRGTLLKGGGEVQIEAAELEIPGSMGTAVGIILNELVTNSVKYAAPEEELRVCVGLTGDTEGVIRLQIWDNGVGFPPSVLQWRETGLGLNLVKALCRQYAGKLTLANSPGGDVTVELRVPKLPEYRGSRL